MLQASEGESFQTAATKRFSSDAEATALLAATEKVKKKNILV
jgi:hypothetical protein